MLKRSSAAITYYPKQKSMFTWSHGLEQVTPNVISSFVASVTLHTQGLQLFSIKLPPMLHYSCTPTHLFDPQELKYFCTPLHPFLLQIHTRPLPTPICNISHPSLLLPFSKLKLSSALHQLSDQK